jgi:PAS domain S-box-containing protein
MPALPEQLKTAASARLFDAVERSAAELGLALFVVHVDAAPPIVVYASELLGRIVGRPVDELVGRPPWEMVAPDVRERVRSVIAGRGAGAPPLFHDTAVERPDGARRAIEVGVARVPTDAAEMAVCYFRDVTEERAAVDALRRSEERFRKLIEDAPDGVAILVAGKIALMNRNAAAMLGGTPESVKGSFISGYLTPDDGARARDRMGQVARGALLGPSEYSIVIPGLERTVEVHSIPCEWEGSPGILAFVRDVTDRKRMQRELERASRLAAVGTMAAAVAHEINNPLTYVQLSLERVERELAALGSEHVGLREHVRNAHHGIGRVATIVRDLRAFARAEAEPTAAVDVAEVIDRALKMVEHDLRHRAQLVRSYTVPVPHVIASAGRLEQVLVNLLINAVQSLASGDPTQDTITIDLRSRGGEVAITVRDTGIGIPEADRDRVFEPFFTTKPHEEGTGLGLAVSKRIVEAMHGRIELTSALGGGTEVTVILPASAAAQAPAAHVPAPEVEHPALRVLVVDDEPLVRRVMRLVLVQNDHHVEEAGNAEAALELLAQRHFDVIVCDLMMPGLTGRDLHERVRDRHPGLERRMVLVTGGAFVPKLAEFLAAIDNPKLDKPFTEAEVLSAVTAAAAR